MLDKQSPIPIYIQIEEQLKQQIQQGDFSVGTSIPSERELSERFAVSRMTVRQSITNLVNDGLLYREKGRGTFVASPKVEQPLNGLTSFTEDMESRGMVPSSKLIGFEILEPESDVAQELQLSHGDQVYFVERIRFADDKPMAIERTFLPVKRFPDLTEESFQGSLYAVIENQQQLKISRATQRMEAGLVKKEDADLLEIQLPAAILIIERISFLEGDLPFEVVRSTYRADRYKFTTEIQR
ncbi:MULTISPECIES: GntR family transcriptional regulator [unclassified Planococcus (in: firmicutes)]|uniref:GntR family transcriptional regulator n=1 Tax=unclassified Planococcus (in: firmicutes) TaxID=2662419 RepID=UPI000C34D2D0|nr:MULTISPECIES: GntR family transcriptional regulator [unclassified Planococcus (in: firmicutes)]AUD15353.1 phosphonate metabolism transcriptional regulator PhnF [Planococcus sp. MB-3u-03]PKG44760.1 phosphonate metabolism transcriptional regulator PhnF [Planococcus sp. Urea-trap-24]PKG87887.1 phosphonate metabolism transcriptional regulator PhnF [Planococcus sp. Urea-3u-39]PKH41158.1 phosphonate metabolism transcriptional regulator PhnF [Planococcus sp. MB-3u-09]